MIYIFIIFLVVILLIVLVGFIFKRSKYSIDKHRHPDDIEGGPPTLREVTGSVLQRGGQPRAEQSSQGFVLHSGPGHLEGRQRNRNVEPVRNPRRWNRMYSDGDVEGDIELPTYTERAAPGTTLMTDRDGKDTDFPPPLPRPESGRMNPRAVELPQPPPVARTRL